MKDAVTIAQSMPDTSTTITIKTIPRRLILADVDKRTPVSPSTRLLAIAEGIQLDDELRRPLAHIADQIIELLRKNDGDDTQRGVTQLNRTLQELPRHLREHNASMDLFDPSALAPDVTRAIEETLAQLLHSLRGSGTLSML